MGKKKSGYVQQPSPLRKASPPMDWPAKPAPTPPAKSATKSRAVLPVAPAILVALALAFVAWAWSAHCRECTWDDFCSRNDNAIAFVMELARVVVFFYAPLHEVAQNASNMRALSLHHIREFIFSMAGAQLLLFVTRLDVLLFRAVRVAMH